MAWGFKRRGDSDVGVFSSETTWVPYFSPLVREISTYLERHTGSFIIDLSHVRNANVEYYAHFAAKVFVEDLSQELAAPTGHNETDEGESFASLLASRGDSQFNVLMCWDLFNYIDTARAAVLSTALTEKAAPGSLLYVHTWASKTMPAQPIAFDLLPEDHISYGYQTSARIPSPGLTKTSVSRLFPEFERTRSFLSRTGIEEHLLRKK
jgi:hypothetical protein